MKKLFSPLVTRISALLMVTIVLLGGIFNSQFSSGNLGGFICSIPLMTDSQIAKFRGITLETLQLLHTQRGLTPSEVCVMPQSKLDRAILRANDPKPDKPDEALAFRKLQLEDEKGYIPADGLVKAAEQIEAMKANGENTDAAGISPGSWTWLGPGNIGGRVRAVVIHPTNTNTMWAASVAGGIWKTTDGGASWQVLDNFMANMAVSTLVIDPANPDVLYAGTGEGFYNIDGIQGAGVFKTTNGGTTWTQLSATNTSDWYFVNRLAISPTGGVLLAATRSGIWRSTDGGTSWLKTSAVETLDINFNPADSTKAVAGGWSGGAQYSTNGGATWTGATFTGIGSANRVEVAYAASSPSTVYASVQVSSGQIWKSTNGGATYSLVNTGDSYLGGQGWYDNIIWVDPTNANNLVVGGIDLYRSTNGGTTLTKISHWWEAPVSAHADQHMVIQDPGFNGTTNKKVYVGNDGGVYRATDIYTVAPTSGWTELNNNLGITQFYGAAGNPTTGEIIGGTQDNGTLFYTPAAGTEAWTTPFGGDGGWSAADPTDPNYFYGEYVDLQIHRSTNRGVSSSYIYSGIADAGNCANFIAPFILDPNNPNTMLAGGCSLWRSINVKAATPTWTSIKPSINSEISAIAVAPGNSDIIWVGHNNGNVYKTTNGTTASPTWTQVDTTTPNLPNRYVTRITIYNTLPNFVFVTFGGFSPDNVWRTTDGGSNWTDTTGSGLTGLPNLPVRSLVIHPSNSNWIYAGTELGIFTSEDGGGNWTLPHDGPSNTSVDELFWMNTTIVAATHGRGLYKSETQAVPAYCTSSGNSSYEYINRVQLGTGDQSSGADGYHDYTATNFTDLAQGSSNPIQVTSIVDGPDYLKAWVDFNQDLDFTDPGEEFDLGSTTLTGGATYVFSGDLVVPNTALTGQTRMRLIIRYTDLPTPCDPYQYGETEDYTVTITQAQTDTTPPDTTIDSAPPDPSNSSTANFTFSGTDNVTAPADLTFQCYLDAGPNWYACTSPQTFTGLSDGHHDFWVYAIDQAGNPDYPNTGYHGWTIATSPTYCASGGDSTYEYISRVQLGTGDQASGGDGYHDYTATNFTDLAQGSSNPIQVTTIVDGPEYLKAWVDFNQDLDFTDPGEEFDLGSITLTGSHVFSGDLVVPNTALTGQTRMRLIIRYTDLPTPCDPYQYGETEDYTVTITQAQTGNVTLRIDPATKQASVNEQFDLVIQAVAGSQELDGVSAYINFNPALLEVVSITPGSSLSVPIQNQYNNTTGTLDYAAGTFSNYPSGTFTVATVKFKAKAVTAGTDILFNTSSPRISDATFGGSSVLSGTEKGTVAIVNTATISGHVDMQGGQAAPSARWSVPISVTLSAPGAPTPTHTINATTDQSGNFTISGIPLGTYDVRVKNRHTLRILKSSVSLLTGTNPISFGLLLEGDSNNDNSVTLVDFSILVTTFGKCQGAAGYDDRPDFNEDNCIALTDFSLLATNFAKVGEMPLFRTRERPDQSQGTVDLLFDPSEKSVSVGEKFTLAVRVQAGSQMVDGAQANLNFDSTYLKVVSITPGSSLSVPIQNLYDNKSGTVDYAAGTFSNFPSGTFNLVLIEFEALQDIPDTQIGFNQLLPRQSDVTFSGASVLGSAFPAQVHVIQVSRVYLPLVVR